MLICGHHIDQTQIIGIGPLMYDKRGELKQLFFMLYLQRYTLKIESVTLDEGAAYDDKQLQIFEYNKFLREYKTVTAQIDRRIATRARKEENIRATVKPKTSKDK